jgi:hypothetical protein
LFLQYIASIAEVLPIIFYLLFLKRNRGEGLGVIFWYCVLSLLTEFAFLFMKQQLVYSSFTILEFSFFSFFFYTSLTEKKFKLIPIIGVVLFYIVAISSFTSKRFDSLPTSVEALLVIAYCILLLYEQMKDPAVGFVYNTKKFWIIIAFFIYFSATLFLFVYTGMLSEADRQRYWPINNFFEMLKNIFFCISFIMKKRPNSLYVADGIDN